MSEETFQVGDEVIVIGSEYGVIREDKGDGNYRVEVENRGMRLLHANHMDNTGRQRGPRPVQEVALRALSNRYNVPYNPAWFYPQFDLPAGYVGGWIGGEDDPKLYVGCDPEGRISS